MIEEVYAIYKDYQIIISICTAKELKYLEKVINGILPKIDFYQKIHNPNFMDKYEWQRNNFRQKFLIAYSFDDVLLPEEIESGIKMAIKKVN